MKILETTTENEKENDFFDVQVMEQSREKGLFSVTIKNNEGVLLALMGVNCKTSYEALHSKEVQTQMKEFREAYYEIGGAIC